MIKANFNFFLIDSILTRQHSQVSEEESLTCTDTLLFAKKSPLKRDDGSSGCDTHANRKSYSVRSVI